MMMGNHYHLFVETPEANLIEGMKWLQNTYTRRFEALQREAPSVGKGVRGPLQVRGGGGRIAQDYGSLVDYIHLNPARAGIVSALLWRATTDIQTAAGAKRCLTLNPFPERAGIKDREGIEGSGLEL